MEAILKEVTGDPKVMDARKMEDYLKENNWLNTKLKSVTEKLRIVEAQLEVERKTQDTKLAELGLKLLEFEDHLRKDQKKVRHLLKAKDKALKEKESVIQSLQCQIDLLEAKLHSASSPGIDIRLSAADLVDSSEEEQVLLPGLQEQSSGKRRDFSHLLYLDLNTDQLAGRRFFRHRDLSPVAEVREDLEEFLISPARSTPRNLLPTMESSSPKETVRAFPFDQDLSSGPTRTFSATANSLSPPVTLSPKDELAESDGEQKEQDTSSYLVYSMDNDMPNISEITDKDSDDMRRIMMCDVDDLLAGGILNTSLEDHVLNLTSNPVTEEREMYENYSSDDSITHLARAEKEIRRSLISESLDDLDERDEFYDCPTPKSMCRRENRSREDNTSSVAHEEHKANADSEFCDKDPLDGPLQLKNSAMLSNGISSSPVQKINEKNTGGNTVQNLPFSLPHDIVQGLVHGHSLLRTESLGSLKDEWSDAKEMNSFPGSSGSSFDKDLNDDAAEMLSNETAELVCDGDTQTKKKENEFGLSEHHNVNGKEVNGILPIDDTKENSQSPLCHRHGKKTRNNSNGEEELDEYDVIEMDVDTRL